MTGAERQARYKRRHPERVRESQRRYEASLKGAATEARRDLKRKLQEGQA